MSWLCTLHNQLRDRIGSAGLLAGLAAIVLAAVYTSQYGFGLEPCELCLAQRWPWWIALGLGILGSLFRHQPVLAGRLPFVLTLVFLAGAGIAGFHVGVEQGWWEGPTACSQLGSDAAMSLDQLRDMVMSRVRTVPCDQPAAVFLGLSMAGWNVLISIAAAAYALWAGLKEVRG